MNEERTGALSKGVMAIIKTSKGESVRPAKVTVVRFSVHAYKAIQHVNFEKVEVSLTFFNAFCFDIRRYHTDNLSVILQAKILAFREWFLHVNNFCV